LKILITGGKSAATMKLLKAFEGQEIILADYGEIPAFSSSSYKFVTLGEINDTIAHNILNVCLDHQVDMLLPLHEFEINPLAKAAVLFEEFNIELLIPDVTDVLKYFYPQQDIVPGLHWYFFRNGNLQFPAVANEMILEVGREKQLQGIYYIPEDVEGVTAMLFTIP
jgi:hypothetical protein